MDSEYFSSEMEDTAGNKCLTLLQDEPSITLKHTGR